MPHGIVDIEIDQADLAAVIEFPGLLFYTHSRKIIIVGEQ